MKRRRSGEDGRRGGPPGELFLEVEKIAILRALDEIPRFTDAEEIALKVMALLLARWRKGNPPKHPKAWVRRAVSRLVRKRWKSPKSCLISLDRWKEEGGWELPDGADLRRRSREYQAWLEGTRERAEALFRERLSRRQEKAFRGILRTRTNVDAAREAGMSKRDLRQARKELINKGKKLQEKGRKFSPPPSLKSLLDHFFSQSHRGHGEYE